jgi:hypothetical protein
MSTDNFFPHTILKRHRTRSINIKHLYPDFLCNLHFLASDNTRLPHPTCHLPLGSPPKGSRRPYRGHGHSSLYLLIKILNSLFRSCYDAQNLNLTHPSSYWRQTCTAWELSQVWKMFALFLNLGAECCILFLVIRDGGVYWSFWIGSGRVRLHGCHI